MQRVKDFCKTVITTMKETGISFDAVTVSPDIEAEILAQTATFPSIIPLYNRIKYIATHPLPTRVTKKYEGKIEGEDYIVCKICGDKGADMGTHIVAHGITSDQYKEMFNVSAVKARRLCDDRKGDKNPGYQHGGKYSAWSKNFIHGYDPERHEKFKEDHREYMRENGHLFKTSYEYWLAEANGDEEEASRLYKAFQARELD
jgi:hypothetical protein